MPESTRRGIDNLKKWTDGTGSLSRTETAYLEREGDLANLTRPEDPVITLSESTVEDCVFWLDRWLGRVS